MIDKIRGFVGRIKNGVVKSDGTFTKKGKLLNNTEIHAFMIYVGMTLAALTFKNVLIPVLIGMLGLALGVEFGKKRFSGKWVEEVQREPQYALGGFVTGFFLFGLVRLMGLCQGLC